MDKEQWWQCIWSFAAGAGIVGLAWAFQALKDLMPDELLADDSLWVEPWTALKERSWQVIAENTEYYGNTGRRFSASNVLAAAATTFAGSVTNENGDDDASIASRQGVGVHIGELRRKPQRSHWPWETIRQRVFDSTNRGSNNSATSANSNFSNNTSSHTSQVSSYETAEQSPDEVPSEVSSEMGVHDVPGDEDDYDYASDDKGVARENKICIGSIFGMDVGGTLAKLVYFEEKPSDFDQLLAASMPGQAQTKEPSSKHFLLSRTSSSLSSFTAAKASLSPFIHMGRETSEETNPRSPTSPTNTTATSSTYRPTGETRSPPSIPTLTARRRSLSLGCMGRFKERSREFQQACEESKQASDRDFDVGENVRETRGFDDPLAANRRRVTVQFKSPNDENDETNKPRKRYRQDQTNGGQSHPLPPPMFAPMKKSTSMFNLSLSQQKAEALDRFYNFARQLDSYENSVRDHKLSFFSRELGGELHFLHFESRHMKLAMDLIRYHNVHHNIAKMGATGGGAHKYANEWDKLLGIQMDKQEELDSLVAGMQFVLATVVGECYTFRPQAQDESGHSSNASVAPGDSDHATDDHPTVAASEDTVEPTTTSTEKSGNSNKEEQTQVDEAKDAPETTQAKRMIDEWWWSRKVQRDAISYSTSYPYLLVTIGTGVSILRVDGPRKHERISGSSIGGGTYWGLIRLLTDVEDFDDVLTLAAKGDPAKVDMMVGDIYGDNSDALEKLGLPSNIVASSFGKLVAKEDPAAGLEQEDLARALLLMITNNIGQVAYLNAKLHKTRRIYFVGNFLRRNMISQRRLSYAIDYWSKGEMEALFLEHEGYFGALGAFLMSQQISQDDGGFFQWGEKKTNHGQSAPIRPRHGHKKG